MPEALAPSGGGWTAPLRSIARRPAEKFAATDCSTPPIPLTRSGQLRVAIPFTDTAGVGPGQFLPGFRYSLRQTAVIAYHLKVAAEQEMRTLDTRYDLNKLTARVSLQQLAKAIALQFTMLRESHERYEKQLVRLTWWLIILTVLLVALTAGLILVAYYTVQNEENSTQTESSISLHNKLSTPTNRSILAMIKSGAPLTEGNGQHYTAYDLEAYVSLSDEILLSYNRGLINDEYLCTMFSEYIRTAYNNKYIMDHVATDSIAKLIVIMNKPEKLKCNRLSPKEEGTTAPTSQLPIGRTTSSLPIAPPAPAEAGANGRPAGGSGPR
jgi:hypothetical protein